MVIIEEIIYKKSEKTPDKKNTDSTPSAKEPVPKNTNESNVPVKPTRNTHPAIKGWSHLDFRVKK